MIVEKTTDCMMLMRRGPTWLGEWICCIVVALVELKDRSCNVESVVTLPVIYGFFSSPDSDLQRIWKPSFFFVGCVMWPLSLELLNFGYFGSKLHWVLTSTTQQPWSYDKQTHSLPTNCCFGWTECWQNHWQWMPADTWTFSLWAQT